MHLTLHYRRYKWCGLVAYGTESEAFTHYIFASAVHARKHSGGRAFAPAEAMLLVYGWCGSRRKYEWQGRNPDPTEPDAFRAASEIAGRESRARQCTVFAIPGDAMCNAGGP